MGNPRTVYLYSRSNYGPGEIDALEYAKRYGEHLMAVRIKQWRAGQNPQDTFLNDLMELVRTNQDALINSRTE